MAQLTASELESSRRYHRARAAARHLERESERVDWLIRVRSAVTKIAPCFPDLRAVYLFGGLAKSSRFHAQSDIDLAVEADSVEDESAFWAAMERALQRPFDVRPLIGPIRTAVAHDGILLYERKTNASDQQHSQ